VPVCMVGIKASYQ